MNLLSYLVPALRDVRAPLIGGYLWLVLGWLWIGHLVPSQAELEPGSVLGALYRLQDVVGTAGVVVSLSVAAYLVGSVASELLGFFLHYRYGGRRAYGVDRLKGLAAAMPELEHATDRAERLYAEAELRFQVALPLAAIAATLVQRGEDVWFVLVLVGFSSAMCWQGLLLLRRTRTIIVGIEQGVHERQQEMSELARRENMADVRVKPLSHERLAVQNFGPKTAHRVDLSLRDGSTPPFLVADLLPIRELRPDDTVELPVGLSMADDPIVDLAVSWADPTGEQRTVQTLHWPLQGAS